MDRTYIPSPAEVAARAEVVRQRWSPETRRWRMWLGQVRQRQLLGVLQAHANKPVIVAPSYDACLCGITQDAS